MPAIPTLLQPQKRRRPVVASTSLMLATDLDGTFLAGESDQRQRLYRLVDAHPEIGLAWVTGRGLEAVLPLLADPSLPRPDYLICDVGATVVHGNSLQPLQPLQADIDSRWPGEHVVAEAMRQFPELVRQDLPQERRCSYYCEPEVLGPIRSRIESVAAQLGCGVLYSADRYLDILPPATSKGSTLSALVGRLGIRPEQVLVAGDTLNDLSMYDVGFPGVCVGKSEAGLLAATRGMPQILHASAPGCGGILQAIEHFELLDGRRAWHLPPLAASTGQADLVMVYHRLPFEEEIIHGQRQQRALSSPNGIVPSLLSFFANGYKGSWVAWSIDDGKVSGFQVHSEVDRSRYPELTAARVPLTKNEVDVFYKRFSKEAFWPVLHGFWERARFREDDWQLFKRVNRRFAETTAREAAPGATVWIHDYNLWMMPAVLRELRPDVKIAFFHHTHFPSSDCFNIIPWRREILGSLLACDYVGFHVPRQAENFVEAVRSNMPTRIVQQASCAPRFMSYGCAVGLDTMTTQIEVGQRLVTLGAHPISTDVGRIGLSLQQQEVQEKIVQVRHEIKDRKLVLSIERLDYTKGILEKLQAFEQFLESSPEMHDKVTLLMVCVPAAKEMTVYRSLQTQIDQAVGRINGRHGRLDWTPIRFFSRPLPFDDVVAHYAAADVMWITPLCDGLNLVAKEFVATQGLAKRHGVLLLSEFAGAAAELKGALLTNPHDPVNMVSTLAQALHMSTDEATSRQRTLFDTVSHHDLARWGRDFLDAVSAIEATPSRMH